MIEQTTDTLAVVTLAERGALIERGRDRAEHDRILTTLAAFNAIETGGAADRTGPLAFPLKVAAWNLERCLFVEASARHLKTLDPALILLSEMDDGMARTGQRHTTRDIAGELGMAYAYGLEFLELGLGARCLRLCAPARDHPARAIQTRGVADEAGVLPHHLLEGASREGRGRRDAGGRAGDECGLAGKVDFHGGSSGGVISKDFGRLGRKMGWHDERRYPKRTPDDAEAAKRQGSCADGPRQAGQRSGRHEAERDGDEAKRQ